MLDKVTGSCVISDTSSPQTVSCDVCPAQLSHYAEVEVGGRVHPRGGSNPHLPLHVFAIVEVTNCLSVIPQPPPASPRLIDWITDQTHSAAVKAAFISSSAYCFMEFITSELLFQFAYYFVRVSTLKRLLCI